MRIIATPEYDILENPVGRNRWSMVDSARLCYKSFGNSSKESDSKLLANCVKNGHWTPIEMGSVKVRFLCDRGVSHELVRHRLASFNQESTRYCNYSLGRFNGEISVVKPIKIKQDSMEYFMWETHCRHAEKTYLSLIDMEVKPETARSVLPTSLATTIDVKANLREWYHILDLRTSRHAHPDIRYMMHGVLMELSQDYPEIFGPMFEARNKEFIEDFSNVKER